MINRETVKSALDALTDYEVMQEFESASHALRNKDRVYRTRIQQTNPYFAMRMINDEIAERGLSQRQWLSERRKLIV